MDAELKHVLIIDATVGFASHIALKLAEKQEYNLYLTSSNNDRLITLKQNIDAANGGTNERVNYIHLTYTGDHEHQKPLANLPNFNYIIVNSEYVNVPSDDFDITVDGSEKLQDGVIGPFCFIRHLLARSKTIVRGPDVNKPSRFITLTSANSIKADGNTFPTKNTPDEYINFFKNAEQVHYKRALAIIAMILNDGSDCRESFPIDPRYSNSKGGNITKTDEECAEFVIANMELVVIKEGVYCGDEQWAEPLPSAPTKHRFFSKFLGNMTNPLVLKDLTGSENGKMNLKYDEKNQDLIDLDSVELIGFKNAITQIVD